LGVPFGGLQPKSSQSTKLLPSLSMPSEHCAYVVSPWQTVTQGVWQEKSSQSVKVLLLLSVLSLQAASEDSLSQIVTSGLWLHPKSSQSVKVLTSLSVLSEHLVLLAAVGSPWGVGVVPSQTLTPSRQHPGSSQSLRLSLSLSLPSEQVALSPSGGRSLQAVTSGLF